MHIIQLKVYYTNDTVEDKTMSKDRICSSYKI